MRDPEGEKVVEPVLRAHEEGRGVLCTTFQSALFSNKGCLAMLSDEESRRSFTPAERGLIDRVLPWTRELAPAVVEYRREHQRRLIVKPRAGFAGTDVHAGWEVGERRWSELLSERVGRGFVAQAPGRAPVGARGLVRLRPQREPGWPHGTSS